MQKVAKSEKFGAPRRDLLIEARRTLGFARTGGRITEVIDGVIQSLLDEGQLRESLENIHPTRGDQPCSQRVCGRRTQPRPVGEKLKVSS